LFSKLISLIFFSFFHIQSLKGQVITVVSMTESSSNFYPRTLGQQTSPQHVFVTLTSFTWHLVPYCYIGLIGFVTKMACHGSTLVVQWLTLLTSDLEGPGSNPG
jgi:hypothetical protein